MVDAGVGRGEGGRGGFGVGLRVVDGTGWGRGEHGNRWSLILPISPEFCVNQAVEAVVAGDALEACGMEGGLGVGEVGDAEAGKDAEGEVEGADVEGGKGAEGSGMGLAEVREEPEGTRAEVRGEVEGEGVDLGLGEAIQEEVGGDEVGG